MPTTRVGPIASLRCVGWREYADYDIVVNLQGDEPFMPVAAVVRRDQPGPLRGCQIGTAAAPMDQDDVDDPALVKVVMHRRGTGNVLLAVANPGTSATRPIATLRAGGNTSAIYAYQP